MEKNIIKSILATMPSSRQITAIRNIVCPESNGCVIRFYDHSLDLEFGSTSCITLSGMDNYVLILDDFKLADIQYEIILAILGLDECPFERYDYLPFD